MNREALERLSKEDLIALVLVLADQVETLTARVAALEAKPGQPSKTPENSSVPPSKGEKANRPERAKKPRPRRPGTCRALAEHPDRTIETFADACPHCQQALTPADQPDVHAYDHLDLPPIKRSATDQAGGDPDRAPPRRLPRLPESFQRPGPAGAGARLAVRSHDCRPDPASSHHPGGQLRTPGAADERGVRPRHQRRRHRSHPQARRTGADPGRRGDRR